MLEKSLRECLSFSRDPGTNKETSFRSALEIVRVLRQAQCCFRCCLRFVGCKRLDLYDSPEQDLEKAFSTLLEDKGETQTRVQVCTACVGSLQIVDSPTFLKAVSDTISGQNYDAKDVQLNSTLPISTLHRDHLLSLHLSDTLNTTSSPRDPKEIFKHILGKHMQEQMKLRIDNKGSLKITVVLQHEPTVSEHLFLTQVKDPVLQIRKKVKKGKTMVFGDSRSTILEALKALSREEAKTLTTVPPQAPTDAAKLSSVDMVHDSCIVGGRYMKYSREFSQTPWAIKGKKLAENSVSECIEGVLKKYYRCDDCKFVPAGREDANVRMLGTGRPFYCELSNPRHTMLTTEEYQKMQQEINTSETKDAVQIRDLSPVKAANTKLIKEGEQHKRKTYRALVWVSEKVTPEMIEKVNAHGSQPFAIQQNTPVRVFQRRSGAIREKMIYHCKVVPPPKKDQADEISDRFLVLTMTAQAGTYIKEFVHGDLGRTIPNLASIAGIQAADLIELDVMNVDLEWPPK